MGFEMGRINHHLIRRPGHVGKLSEYPVEHAKPAPTDEPVVDRLVRAVIRWGVTPAQPVADHKDDATENPPVINPRNPVR